MVAELVSLSAPNIFQASLELFPTGQPGLPHRPSVGSVFKTIVENDYSQIINKDSNVNLPPQWRPATLLWVGFWSFMVMWASTVTGAAVSRYTMPVSEMITATLPHLEYWFPGPLQLRFVSVFTNHP